ncbi:MAG: O-antigen ligase family protein [Solirubrobacteraceae bacterium]
MLSATGGLLLAAPTALAFFSGGYFDEARAWAGAGVWLAVVVAALAGARVPRERSAWLALGSLALLAAWTLLSLTWAPIAGRAYHAGQIAILYLGALLAAATLLRGRLLSWVEPALAAGTVIVVGYGLAGRLLPGWLHYARSVSAGGRLEQPLTYWNAMGELAALGLVLCARLAGDRARPRGLRAAAVAACAPLGLGLYVSFSRGALFAGLAGLIALLTMAPRREQLQGIAASLAAAVLAALASAAFSGVTALSGSLSSRETQGAIVLLLLVVVAGLTGTAHYILGNRGVQGELRLPPRTPWIAAGAIAIGLALAIVVGARESSVRSQALAGGATRLVSLQSNRYDYWSVAIRAFASSPLHGVGAGGWSVDWLRWRHVNEAAQDAHSLPLQTLAELGLVGIVLLAGFVTGVVLAAARALRRSRSAVGPAAAVVAYFAHSPLDWDWQMPALTLVAIALIGALLAIGDTDATSGPAAAERSAGLPA